MFVRYSNVLFMEGNWVVMGVEFGDGVIVLCENLYIGISVCLLRTAMLCLWKLIGLLWECIMAGLFYCVTVYISVFGVCLLRTAMLYLWKEQTDTLGLW